MATLDLMDQQIRATDKMTLLRHIQTYRIETSDEVRASVVSYASSGGSGTHAGGGIVSPVLALKKNIVITPYSVKVD